MLKGFFNKVFENNKVRLLIGITLAMLLEFPTLFLVDTYSESFNTIAMVLFSSMGFAFLLGYFMHNWITKPMKIKAVKKKLKDRWVWKKIANLHMQPEIMLMFLGTFTVFLNLFTISFGKGKLEFLALVSAYCGLFILLTAITELKQSYQMLCFRFVVIMIVSFSIALFNLFTTNNFSVTLIVATSMCLCLVGIQATVNESMEKGEWR